MISLALLLLATATAAPDDPEAPEAPEAEGWRWSPMVLPLVGFDSKDGLGVGVGGEVFGRPRSQEYGYRWKFTGSLYTTLDLNYSTAWLRFDHRGATSWVGTLAWQRLGDLRYAGTGGTAIYLDHGEAEADNVVVGPYGFLGTARPLGNSPFALYAQLYGRYAVVRPSPGGLLDQQAPLGSSGAAYGDLSVGIELEDVDQWPLPNQGTKGEADLRAGLTFAPDGAVPVMGLHVRAVRWWSPLPDRFTLGLRGVAAWNIGERPFFEESVTGGRWRVDMGDDQVLTGYGLTRPRAQGVAAAQLEARARLVQTHHPFWDLGVHLSVFAEQAFLIEPGEPTPHLPTVGFGPVLLWQKAIMLRPYAAWGWRAPTPDAPRRPGMVFGISFVDPL